MGVGAGVGAAAGFPADGGLNNISRWFRGGYLMSLAQHSEHHAGRCCMRLLARRQSRSMDHVMLSQAYTDGEDMHPPESRTTAELSLARSRIGLRTDAPCPPKMNKRNTVRNETIACMHISQRGIARRVQHRMRVGDNAGPRNEQGSVAWLTQHSSRTAEHTGSATRLRRWAIYLSSSVSSSAQLSRPTASGMQASALVLA